MSQHPRATAQGTRERVQDWILAGVIHAAVAVVVATFVWLLGSMLVRGARHVSWEFLTTDPLRAGRAGGIAPILMSTFAVLAVCMAVAVPVGLGTAVLLSEFTDKASRFGHLVRRSLDVLAGVPSIVFGLFGNAFFCKVLGLGFSILSGGLTLACMVLPILIRSTEEGLRALPSELRLSAVALGLSMTATIRHLLLPAAAPGLVVSLVLGVGRAMAETAALIFTSGYVDRMPTSLFDSGRVLSVHIYDMAMNVPGGDDAAYATALTLVAMLVLINTVTSWMVRRSLQWAS